MKKPIKGNCSQSVLVGIAIQPSFTADPSVGDCNSDSESLEGILEVQQK